MEFRNYTGVDNNKKNSNWGAAGQPLLRSKTNAAYADGRSALAGPTRKTPREISNIVCQQKDTSGNKAGLSDFVWAWGQFLDHEIDFTPSTGENVNMYAPDDDPDTMVSGGEIPFKRSKFDELDGVREQVNELSSFIDATNVYGNNERRASELRTYKGGRLKVNSMPGIGDLLPFNEKLLENDHPNPAILKTSHFLAGDIRCNEHAVLTSLHTLFVREHNYQADKIANANPKLDDENIYQKARKIVGGIMQAITFNEFLPSIFGDDIFGPYEGYDENINPGIENIFSTACYRFGHSMLSETITVVNEEGVKDSFLLRELFWNPKNFYDLQTKVVFKSNNVQLKIDDFFRGMAINEMQEIDNKVVESIRSFLFHSFGRQPSPRTFMDLAALNIQRGRDHGLADYNQCREDYGLERVFSFSDITSKQELQVKLSEAYTDVDDIDVWVGGLCEDSAQGCVGELITEVLKDQFQRLRSGDRFWYENDPDLEEEKEAISKTTLADVILRNTQIESIQKNVFFVIK